MTLETESLEGTEVAVVSAKILKNETGSRNTVWLDKSDAYDSHALKLSTNLVWPLVLNLYLQCHAKSESHLNAIL